MVGEVFIPFKDPPLTLHAGRAPGPSCGSRSPLTSELTGRRTKLDDPTKTKENIVWILSFTFCFRCTVCFSLISDLWAFVGTIQSCTYGCNLKMRHLFVFFHSLLFAVSESAASVPKKMDLTKENLSALLGAGSFKQKTPSTFSRGSAQTSGGRGPGERGREDQTCSACRESDCVRKVWF